MKIILIGYSLIILFLCNLVSASSITYNVRDFNTLQPIESVNISAYNTLLYKNSTLTDLYGNANMYLDSYDNYSVEFSRSAFQSIQVYRNYTNDTIESFYMNPQSTAGIIRLTTNDLTLKDHDFCIYFADNMRLDKCYTVNDTAIIHVNMNYVIMPKVNKYDLITNTESLGKYIYFIIPIFFIILVIVLPIAVLIGLVLLVLGLIRRK